MTTGGFPTTRRLILKGAGVVGAGRLRSRRRSVSRRHSPPPTTNIRRRRSSRRARRTRSRRSTARPRKPPTRSSSTRPEIAENGAVVPISVSSTLADVTSIAILVAENPNALVGLLQDSGRHGAERRQPHQDGEDQQRGRRSSRPAASSTARPRRSRSPSAAAAADQIIDRERKQWHRQFACAPPRTARPPKSSR